MRRCAVKGFVVRQESGIPSNTWLLLATVVCARFCLGMRVGCGDKSWGRDGNGCDFIPVNRPESGRTVLISAEVP